MASLSPSNQLPHHFAILVHSFDSQIIDKTKLIYLTYPNISCIDSDQKVFDEAIAKFKDTDTKIVHDFAYGAFGFDANLVYLLQKWEVIIGLKFIPCLKVITCQR